MTATPTKPASQPAPSPPPHDLAASQSRLLRILARMALAHAERIERGELPPAEHGTSLADEMGWR